MYIWRCRYTIDLYFVISMIGISKWIKRWKCGRNTCLMLYLLYSGFCFLPMLPKVGKILNKSELSSLCFGPKHKGEERKESLKCRNQLSFPGSDDMVPGGELRAYLQLEFWFRLVIAVWYYIRKKVLFWLTYSVHYLFSHIYATNPKCSLKRKSVCACLCNAWF